MLVAATVVAGALLAMVTLRPAPAVPTSKEVPGGLACNEFVELVSSFLYDTLGADTRQRFVASLCWPPFATSPAE